MAMSRRLERLSGLFQEELSELLLRQVKDPRLAQFVSITRVVISPDLRHARVYVSVMGSEEEKVSTLEGLTAAAPFLRRQLTSRLTLRRIPELSFRRDDSLEKGSRVLDLLKQISDDTDNP
ncbi:MAG: ribosome-binding factor A [Dehalococcoidia bacterium SM23_28_2]|nr:MAG: ribosome-binding factor A [Dehalococcoidia bacterium SM23_28_2]